MSLVGNLPEPAQSANSDVNPNPGEVWTDRRGGEAVQVEVVGLSHVYVSYEAGGMGVLGFPEFYAIYQPDQRCCLDQRCGTCEACDAEGDRLYELSLDER